MRAHMKWSRVAILSVVAALVAGSLAWHLSSAPLIDCSPPPPDRPTISVPSVVLDADNPRIADVSIRGELVDVQSRADSFEFTIRDADRGLLTLGGHLGGSVALDLLPGSDVSVSYVSWVGTGMGGAHLVVLDERGLVFAIEEGSGTSGAHPPFVVTNVTGRCTGRGPTVPSTLVFSADGLAVSAAAGESGTLSVDGRDYRVHTFEATEIVDSEAFDVAPEGAFVIARVPE
jgi:hypothetical protein